MLPPHCPETFLHYIWKFKLFNFNDLQTTEGEPLSIVQTGFANTNAGADFSEARIQLKDLLWVGNVEIHKKSSDWLQHQHQHDLAYNSVILHVVYEEDTPIFYTNGKRIPTLELKNRIPTHLIQRYWTLHQSATWIPCQAIFPEIAPEILPLWLERMLVERLEKRVTHLQQDLLQQQQHWEQLFYQSIARSLGTKVNAEPMERVAQSLPLLTLAKHKKSLMQLEALLFGQANLLKPDAQEAYPQQLWKEYQYLQKKYNLQPIEAQSWKFSKMRPANFPTIRLAQLAQLVFQSTHLFSKILEANELKTVQGLFELTLSDYWQTHFQLDEVSPTSKKTLGKDTINLLLINTIVPFLFVYGKTRGEEKYVEKAFSYLEQLPPESNSIIEHWQQLGATADSAYQTQALLQLKNEYCDQKRCLECAIGNKIMKF